MHVAALAFLAGRMDDPLSTAAAVPHLIIHRQGWQVLRAKRRLRVRERVRVGRLANACVRMSPTRRS